MSAKVHSTAWVDEGVQLGEGVEIGPFAVIYRGVTLGPGCRVHAGAVLGDTPQDLGFGGGESFVRIGARTVIREHVTVHRGTKPGTTTEVGEDCLLMANSHVAHNVRVGNRVIVVNGVLLAGYVEVGDGAILSGHAMVHQYGRIGRLAMLSGGAAVTKDVPPFLTARTATYNRISGINVIGMRRAGMPPADRAAVKEAVRVLYFQGLGLRPAAQRLAQEFPAGPAREIADFVLASTRGVCTFAAGEEHD